MNNVPEELLNALGHFRLRHVSCGAEILRRLCQGPFSPDPASQLFALELLYIVSTC